MTQDKKGICPVDFFQKLYILYTGLSQRQSRIQNPLVFPEQVHCFFSGKAALQKPQTCSNVFCKT